MALICLAIFLPICILTPCYYADDGGYIQMLSYFMHSGKVDLMHWSQPTAIGLLLVGSPLISLTGLGFTQVDCIGLLFAIAAVIGVHTLIRRQTSATTAFLLALSIFCFNEVTFVTPTFMTDMPFLAYLVWCLVFTERILSTEQPRKSSYLAWSVLLLLALLTRSTGLLLLPGVLLAAIACGAERKRLGLLTLLFVSCVAIVVLTTHFFSVNQPTVLETTALREIFNNHDFARFNLRAMALTLLSVIFSLTPLLVAMKAPDKKLRLVQICCSILGAVLAAYFAHKGLLQPLGKVGAPLVVLCVAFAAWNLPLVVSAAISRNKVLSLVLITFIALQFAVLPIMAHPLVRHSVPGMVALVILIAIANSWRTSAPRIIAALSTVLIFYNVITLEQVRLESVAGLELAQGLIKEGIAPSDIDAGWAWFCYQALKPGSNDPQHYVDKYNFLRSHARFFIGTSEPGVKGGRTLTRLPVDYFAQKSEMVVVEGGTPE